MTNNGLQAQVRKEESRRARGESRTTASVWEPAKKKPDDQTPMLNQLFDAVVVFVGIPVFFLFVIWIVWSSR